MRRKLLVNHFRTISFLLFVSLVCAILGALSDSHDITVSKKFDLSEFTVVIDAGHGGEDGGAVGVTGALEKDINLSVCKKLYSLLSMAGINCSMTRTDDRLLYFEGQSNSKKYHDVRNRVSFVQNFENPIFLSIHQNKFPVSKYRGLQVYYSDNNRDSEVLAEIVQSTAKLYLQPNNNRKIKESGGSIYLMKKLECPAVLVECGFMSNPEEEIMLCDSEYQSKLAFVIFSSIMNYLTQINEKGEVLQ